MSGPNDRSHGDDRPKGSWLARRAGAPRAAAVQQRESVRASAPKGRDNLETSRGRLVVVAGGFAALFAAVVIKLTLATVILPVEPKQVAAVRHPEPPPPTDVAGLSRVSAPISPQDFGLKAPRATITDRNGEPLALSLPIADLIANPKVLYDVDQIVVKLRSVLPKQDPVELKKLLSKDDKQFVYLARRISPREMLAINALGIPGIDFEHSERRRYPLGTVAAQVLGGVDVDGHGVAGIEKFFETRLRDNPEPLKLSLDLRVQAVMRDELSKAVTDFTALGGCGIMMDVRTGEILAMVNLPDFDNNNFGKATNEQRFNRATFGLYEPGSTFKLQTAAMALDSGIAQIWNIYDASSPIHIGRFTISDFEGKHRPLYLPEVLAYSSNIGAAKIALTVGAERQREWHQKVGMLSRIPIELPETRRPMAPSPANWKDIATMTIAFGHGIAVTPLHVVRGTSAVANGGVEVRPTLLARNDDDPPVQGERVMQQSTSDTMRKLMRLVVTDGFGKSAEVPGYYVGGKTGTAEKSGPGGYKKHVNVQAFTSVFPMNAPRYAVYMMLDEAHANANTHGYATAGWVIAPAVGRVIARAAPMLGMLPDMDNAAAIQASLYIPLEPTRGVVTTPPPASVGGKPAPTAPVASAPRAAPRSAQQVPAQPSPGQLPPGQLSLGQQPRQKPPTLAAPSVLAPAPLRREVKAVVPSGGENVTFR